MKRKYVKPDMLMETFIPTEYARVCQYREDILSANVLCAIAGTDAYHVNDGSTTRESPCNDHAAITECSNGDEGLHSTYCSGNIQVNSTGGVEPGTGQLIYGLKFGQEMSNNSRVTCNMSATNTDWGSLHVGKSYYAKWFSKDNCPSGAREYAHYGLLKITGTIQEANLS